MRILSVDLGEVRTGLAVCDSGETLASPLSPIVEKNKKILINKVSEQAVEQGAKLIVCGLPVNMDGTEGARAKLCREIAEKIEFQSGIKTVMWDERGTTKTAIFYMNQTDTRGKKRKQAIDSASASVILQSYLDYRRNNKQATEL